jgi:hypothetical protein
MKTSLFLKIYKSLILITIQVAWFLQGKLMVRIGKGLKENDGEYVSS